MKFVYVTPELRNAKFANNVKEHDLIIRCGQPSHSFVNDKEGEFTDTAFEMDSSYYKTPPYEFNNEIDSKTFTEISDKEATPLIKEAKTRGTAINFKRFTKISQISLF